MPGQMERDATMWAGLGQGAAEPDVRGDRFGCPAVEKRGDHPVSVGGPFRRGQGGHNAWGYRMIRRPGFCPRRGDGIHRNTAAPNVAGRGFLVTATVFGGYRPGAPRGAAFVSTPQAVSGRSLQEQDCKNQKHRHDSVREWAFQDSMGLQEHKKQYSKASGLSKGFEPMPSF